VLPRARLLCGDFGGGTKTGESDRPLLACSGAYSYSAHAGSFTKSTKPKVADTLASFPDGTAQCERHQPAPRRRLPSTASRKLPLKNPKHLAPDKCDKMPGQERPQDAWLQDQLDRGGGVASAPPSLLGRRLRALPGGLPRPHGLPGGDFRHGMVSPTFTAPLGPHGCTRPPGALSTASRQLPLKNPKHLVLDKCDKMPGQERPQDAWLQDQLDRGGGVASVPPSLLGRQLHALPRPHGPPGGDFRHGTASPTFAVPPADHLLHTEAARPRAKSEPMFDRSALPTVSELGATAGFNGPRVFHIAGTLITASGAGVFKADVTLLDKALKADPCIERPAYATAGPNMEDLLGHGSPVTESQPALPLGLATELPVVNDAVSAAYATVRYYVKAHSTVRFYIKAYSTVRYYVKAYSTARYHVKAHSTVRYYVKAHSTVRYYGKAYSTVRYYAKDLVTEDGAKKDLVTEDGVKKDLVTKDGAKKDLVTTDGAKKDPVTEDGAKKDLVTEDGAKKAFSPATVNTGRGNPFAAAVFKLFAAILVDCFTVPAMRYFESGPAPDGILSNSTGHPPPLRGAPAAGRPDWPPFPAALR
jgi:pentapeptide MXKDX repeat protein